MWGCSALADSLARPQCGLTIGSCCGLYSGTFGCILMGLGLDLSSSINGLGEATGDAGGDSLEVQRGCGGFRE